jgi:hypothetical protein
MIVRFPANNGDGRQVIAVLAKHPPHADDSLPCKRIQMGFLARICA